MRRVFALYTASPNLILCILPGSLSSLIIIPECRARNSPYALLNVTQHLPTKCFLNNKDPKGDLTWRIHFEEKYSSYERECVDREKEAAVI